MNRKTARLLLALSIPVAFSISAYGRLIQNLLGEHAQIIPFVAIAILALIIVGFTKAAPKEQLKAFGFFIGYTILIEFVVVRWLIVDPVERIHFIKYGIIAYLAFCSQKESTKAGKRLLLAFLFSAGLGTLEEGFQFFVPSRVFDLRDIGFNVTGAALGALYCKLRYYTAKANS